MESINERYTKEPAADLFGKPRRVRGDVFYPMVVWVSVLSEAFIKTLSMSRVTRTQWRAWEQAFLSRLMQGAGIFTSLTPLRCHLIISSLSGRL